LQIREITDGGYLSMCSGPILLTGRQVAFAWNGENEDNFDICLKLVGASDVRRITTDPAPDVNPAWSPDGRLIAFVRERPQASAVAVSQQRNDQLFDG
jgi:Tol biopolymer transport system component